MAQQKGLKCTKSNFWANIRNPLYCGKIFIPKYKEEEAHLVKGQQEALISEALFYQVQDVLDGRKRQYKPKFVANAILPLRGFLICPTCGKMLTGSKSKGRTQDYYYYHCIYQLSIREAWYDQTKHVDDLKRQLSNQMADMEQRLNYLRELLATQKVEPEDYRRMKAEYTEKIDRLLVKMAEPNQNYVDIEGLLRTGTATLLHLEKLYLEGDIIKKKGDHWFDIPRKIDV